MYVNNQRVNVCSVYLRIIMYSSMHSTINLVRFPFSHNTPPMMVELHYSPVLFDLMAANQAIVVMVYHNVGLNLVRTLEFVFSIQDASRYSVVC